jgi:hypothetical protein
MKVCIIGDNWMSKLFIKELNKNNINYLISNFNENSNDLLSDILDNKISHVIYSNGFEFENEISNKNLDEKLIYNIQSPVKIAIFCQRYKIHFTYIGNGNIYINESNSDLFNEEDEPNNKNNDYFIINGCTDRLIKTTDSLNLRFNNPISSDINDSNNFLKKLITESYIYDISSSISIIDELIPLSINLIKNKVIGTFNFVNSGIISYNEILTLYKNICDNNFSWKCCSENKLKTNYCYLDSSLLELNYKITPIKDAIINILKAIHSNHHLI